MLAAPYPTRNHICPLKRSKHFKAVKSNQTKCMTDKRLIGFEQVRGEPAFALFFGSLNFWASDALAHSSNSHTHSHPTRIIIMLVPTYFVLNVWGGGREGVDAPLVRPSLARTRTALASRQ